MRYLSGSVWESKDSIVARLCAGQSAFTLSGIVLFMMSKENQKNTSDFDALDPRERGCSPLSDPKGEVETEKS